MKGDITIRPVPDRDARLQKIATRYGTTVNQIISLTAEAISHAPPSHFYHCLAAIQDRVEELKQRNKRTPRNTGL
jgi:hypothetical protein